VLENTIPKTLGFTSEDGSGIYQGTASDASSFKDQAVEYKNSLSLFQELSSLNDKITADPLLKADPATRAQATVIATQLQGALKNSIVGGKLTDRDITFLQAIAKNPTTILTTPGAVKAGLNQAMADAKRSITNKAMAGGLVESPSAPVSAVQAASSF